MPPPSDDFGCFTPSNRGAGSRSGPAGRGRSRSRRAGGNPSRPPRSPCSQVVNRFSRASAVGLQHEHARAGRGDEHRFVARVSGQSAGDPPVGGRGPERRKELSGTRSDGNSDSARASVARASAATKAGRAIGRSCGWRDVRTRARGRQMDCASRARVCMDSGLFAGGALLVFPAHVARCLPWPS
jgi:hypothetical protein